MDRRYGRPWPHPDTARSARRREYSPLPGPRPDRVAAWAVGLGIFLILVAAATSQGWTGGARVPPGPAPASRDGGALDQATAAQLRRLQARVGLTPGSQVDAAARTEIVSSMLRERATWFGPGFYGRSTACGVHLARTTDGVAHRTLPCGTPVTLYYHGRFKTVPVIDRGPFARGVSWDLAAATARGLGFSRSGSLRVIH